MFTFEDCGLSGGVWSGLLHGPKSPQRVNLVHLGQSVAEAELSQAGTGEWQLRVRLPGDILSDGVQSFMLMAEAETADDVSWQGAEHLASLTILAGTPLDQDINVELELLRAEIDLLKRELRRLAVKGQASGSL